MKTIRYYSAIFLICFLLAGCGTTGHANDSSSADIPADQSSVSLPEQEAGQEPERFIENISNNEEGHYAFNPHVFGSRYLEQFGESKRDAFFAYCDALRNGEDSFACPDQDFVAGAADVCPTFSFLWRVRKLRPACGRTARRRSFI